MDKNEEIRDNFFSFTYINRGLHMKFFNLTVLGIVSTVFLGTGWAEDSLPIKSVSLPFNNELIFSKANDGLSFTYDMYGAPTKKVICKFSNAFRSWIEGTIDFSPTFGGNQTIVFTSLAKSQEVSDTIYIIHVNNPVGEIKIHDTNNGQISNVSCYYENEKINN